MKSLNRWQAIAAIAAFILPLASGMGYGVYTHFAKAGELLVVAERLDKNTEGDFRLRQQIINNTRSDREERSLPANPAWLQQQQRQLDLERCLYRQRTDKKVKCDR